MLPNRIFINAQKAQCLSKPSTEDDHGYIRESLIPDNRTLSDIARNYTTEGENSDLIFHCYLQGMLKLKSILKSSQ